jgi:CYTH domain-containing protein
LQFLGDDMAREIERKFLVKGNFKPFVYQSTPITQGYLSSAVERTVRVRVQEDAGLLTVKGKSSAKGASRYEWEREISVSDAQELLALCELGIIEKVRNLVKVGAHIFEVDEFYADNEGLILAEVELNAVDERFEKPEWLGEEVTGNSKYYNAALSKNPYKNWK